MMTVEEVKRLCINQELKPFNITYDELLAGDDWDTWYTKYSFESEQAFLDWKDFCIKRSKRSL